MQEIKLEGSPKTPSVHFDPETGVLELKGRSIPENALDFFHPLNEWLEEYKNNPKKETVVELRLEYFNTSSSKCILDFLRKLEKINGNNTDVKVNWYYEKDDEDMLEAGEDYKAIVDLSFSFVEVDEI